MKQIITLFTMIAVAFSLNAQYIYNDFDANQNETFTGWPNVPAVVANPDQSGINTSAGVAEFVRTNWAQWDHASTELTGKIDFTTGTVFTIKVHSPIACQVLFKLEDKTNGGIFTERSQNITTPNTWEELTFDFTGEASGTYDKIVIFFDFATFNENTFYFDDVEGPYYEGSQGKPLEAADVQDNFENNGWGTINDWIFQNPGLDPLPTTTDPVNASNTVADYNRTGAFEWANAQADLDHRMDLSNRNIFEMKVFFPSANDYTGALTPTAAIKLQNSLMGGNAWMTQTQVTQTVTDFDQWVTLTFDFSAVADSVNYDKIVVQFGGEGHWVPGQFYFDDIELLPWYSTPVYTYNDFDAMQNVDFTGYPNPPVIVTNPDQSGINTSAMSGEWVRTADQWAHIYTVLEGPIDFTTGENFQIKVHSPIMCDVLFKLENSNNAGVFLEATSTIWTPGEWTLLNFDFTGAANDTYDKIVIFLDFASTNDNTFYIDDIMGPEYEEPKPVLELNVQDNFENDGWSTIDYWILQDPNMDTMPVVTGPVDPANHVGDYMRSGTFEWTNAQTILDHRMDLSERNKFEVDVYFPSSNDYSGPLATTASVKLQNSLLGGMAWTTQAEIVNNVDVFDEWVTLLFDFEAYSDSINYDQIVVQLGGEGHWASGQFYFDNFYLKHVPEVTVVSPNGGESIDQGETFEIVWDYAWWEGNMQIELQKGEDAPQLVVSSVATSDSSFMWTVFPDQEPGDDYRIILTSLDNSFPTDTSDNYFTIVEVTAIIPNFSASSTDIGVGESVTFTDNTTGSPISWEWTFEGGTPESYSGQNPPDVVYNTPGSFDVTLEVSDGITTYTELKEDYIFVGEPPVADFEASLTTILVGETVDFTSTSIGDDLTFEWYFEGGTPETSTDENPSGIMYNEMGMFDVQLIVTNEYGTDTLLMEDYITAEPVGIDENEIAFSVWPNPAQDVINVSVNFSGTYTVKIYSITGTLVVDEAFAVEQTLLNVSSLDNGMYIVVIEGSEAVKAYKKILIN